MDLSIGHNNLAELFGAGNRITVPSFQRNYAWDLENLAQFCGDVISSAETGVEHFFGPIVTLKEGPNDFQLIDGQQRVTTSVMALAILRDALLDTSIFDSPKLKSKGNAEIDLTLGYNNILFNGVFLDKPKFQANYFIGDMFLKSVIAAPTADRPAITKAGTGLSKVEKDQTKEFRAAYVKLSQLLRDHLLDIDDLDDRKMRVHDLLQALTTHFRVVSLQLTSEDDAYILFENLNHRGVRLAPADLLKTLLLRNIKQKGRSELHEALESWDAITSIHLQGTQDFTKFLRHYLLTQKNENILASKIYPTFRDVISAAGVDGASKTLGSLVDSAASYAQLLGNTAGSIDELTNAFIRLELLGETYRVIMLRGMQMQLSESALLTLSKAVEVVAFRWTAAGGNAQELENLFRTNAHKIVKGISDSDVAEVCASLLLATPKDDALESIHRSGRDALAKYVLQVVEISRSAGYFDWSNTPTLEHLAPQNPGAATRTYWHYALQIDPTDDAAVAEADYKTRLHLWGNLTLLEKKLNSSIQNNEWLIKRDGMLDKKWKGIKNSGFENSKDLIALDTWTLDHIESRGEWLRDSVLKLRSTQWAQGAKLTVQPWKYVD